MHTGVVAIYQHLYCCVHDVLQDVFYLTVEELFAFVDGRAVTNDIAALVELRKREYDGYRKVGGAVHALVSQQG